MMSTCSVHLPLARAQLHSFNLIAREIWKCSFPTGPKVGKGVLGLSPTLKNKQTHVYISSYMCKNVSERIHKKQEQLHNLGAQYKTTT
jgi:hypothetical protein